MWQLADKMLTSRLLLGSAKYPSLKVMQQAILASETNVVTIALKRQLSHQAATPLFWETIKNLNCHLLPNTAGCHDAKDAIQIAEMAREICQTNWVKLEVIGDEETLCPDSFELVKAAKALVDRGFEVFPYCTSDLIVCQRLVDAGCRILMPWGSPIGSGKGLLDIYSLTVLRERLTDITLIIDAGIGKPSHAVQALELGFDGVLLNSAVSLAHDPIKMAAAFKAAVIAGREAFMAGMIAESHHARPSTSLIDTPFWLHGKEK